MDLHAVLTIVETGPVEDRLKLVREVWDRLLEQGCEPELPEAWKEELDRRLADDESAAEDVISWETVRAEAIARVDV